MGISNIFHRAVDTPPHQQSILLLPSHEMSNELIINATTHLLKSQQHSIIQAHTHWLISTFSCPAFCCVA
jgi:hypothetical protein